VRVRLTDGRIRPFTRLVPKPGWRWCGWVEACKKAGWVRCRAVGLWRGPYKEPWLSLTNWHDDTVLVLDDYRIGVGFRAELADG
jgi:hypothetical protein